MTAAPRQDASYAGYLALEAQTGQRHEHLNGEAWAMAGGTPRHAELAMSVGATLLALARPRGCRVYSSDLRVYVATTGLTTYPDVAIVCGEVQVASHDRNAVSNPTVLVEVLSESTEAWDRGGKAAHYRRVPSLQAYVLVAQDEAHVEVYTRAADGWTLTEARAGESVAIPCLGGRIEVDAIYGA
jgi:Uma2 family endonuclease